VFFTKNRNILFAMIVKYNTTIKLIVLLQAERSALVKLAEKTEDDIRSCINSLQFLSMANNPASVSMDDVEKATMGKDQTRTLQFALKNILSLGKDVQINDRVGNVSYYKSFSKK
jgi:hypothetical protein